MVGRLRARDEYEIEVADAHQIGEGAKVHPWLGSRAQVGGLVCHVILQRREGDE